MSQELIEMLQEAAAREISVSVQYMWHHIMAKGLASPEFRRIVKDISIVEMRHAEAIAERLDYLGEVPTTKPTPIDVGGGLLNMIDNDVSAERDAIELYKRIVNQAEAERDIVTRTLFEGILADEEDHESQFSALLEDRAA